MGKTETSCLKSLKAFKKKLSKKYPVEKMILYGSRARGDFLKHSDVDIIIVSSAFKDIPFSLRMYEAGKYWQEDLALEAFCYTPEEFAYKEKESTYMKHILKEGIVV